MKTMIDRANSLYDSDYKFTDIYMLTTAAEAEPEVPNRAIGGLTGDVYKRQEPRCRSREPL